MPENFPKFSIYVDLQITWNILCLNIMILTQY